MNCFSFRLHAPCLLFFLAAVISAHAQWQPLNGPFGTNIHSTHQSNGTLLASSPTGIYRFDNSSTNWLHAYNGLGGYAFASVGSRLYAGMYQGILVSDDNGYSWQALESDLPQSSITTLAYNGSALYAGSFSMGVYISPDNGAHWQRSSDGLPNTYVTSLAVAGSTVFVSLVNDFGSENGGVFIQEQNGSWSRLSSIVGSGYTLYGAGSTLFALGWEAAYRSENSGTTWTQLALPDSQVPPICLLATDEALYAGTNGRGVFRSTDNGDTWSPAGMDSFAITTLASQGAALIAGTVQQGLYISHNNGETWEAINTGIVSTMTVPVLAADNNSIYASAENSELLYKSSDNGATWSMLQTPDVTTSTITALAVANSTLLAGTSMEGVFTSDVNGTLWQAASGIRPRTWISNFLQDGSTLLAGTISMSFPATSFSGVHLSHDMGITWEQTDLPVAALSFTKHNGALYAGTSRDVRVSTDGGAHWIQTGPANVADSDIYSLASNGTTLFAGSYNNGIFVSHNNGITWTASTTGLPALPRVMRFAVYEQTVFAATEGGIFKTTGDGMTWESISDGLTSYDVRSLVIKGDYLYAGVTNSAVWRRPLSELVTTGVGEQGPSQKAFELFPHPVTSFSTLRLCTSCELRNAALVIADIAGQTVRTTTGLYGASVEIRKENLTPGVYTFSVEEGGTVITSGTFVVE